MNDLGVVRRSNGIEDREHHFTPDHAYGASCSMGDWGPNVVLAIERRADTLARLDL